MASTDSSDRMEEHNCDLCKISYVTEKELKDHEWSLMHHIKVEQKKKGSVHKCSLCLTTCPNLIDYGKHLNGDKHKQAIEESRVHTETLTPQEIQSRLHSGDKDEELEQEHVRLDSRPHQRSQPSSRGQFHGNRRPYRRPGPGTGHYYDYEGRFNQNSFENPHWHKSGMRQMFPYQWRQPWEVTSPDPWEHPNHSPEEMDYQFHDNSRRNSYSQSSEHYELDRGPYGKYSRPEHDHDVDKRRFDSEEGKKAVRFEDEVDETPEYSSKPQSNQESKRRKRNTDVAIVEHPPGGRTTKNSKGRLVDSPVCEADSTTDIEMTAKSKKESGKKSDAKKKTSTKAKKKKGNKLSPRSDEGESVLERAEKLCKELRDKREKAKKENQKGKKVEKNQEINKQLAKLSEINKSYVKGVLSSVDQSEVHVRTSVLKSSQKMPSTITSETISSSGDNRPPIGTRSKSNIDKVSKSNAKGRANKSVTGGTSVDSDSSDNVSSVDKLVRKSRDINDIRKEIEADVSKSQNTSKKSLDESNNGLNDDEPELGESSENADSSKSRLSMESTSRESLLKMVNSPRSRKERQQLAEVLRTYAKSQKRLSLPRFNLHMPGLYDNLENYGDFRLEELSPDVQLQIAELIEADVKPDLDELEKSLLSEIKAERLDDYLPASPHVDKLEILDTSLKDNKAGTSRLSNVDPEMQSGFVSLDDIKKEPVESAINPQSPQYSQEEREFIEKFCSPGSPVQKSPNRHVRAESQPSFVSPSCHANDTDITSENQRKRTSHLREEYKNKVRLVGLRSRSNSLSALPTDGISMCSDAMISRPEQSLNKKDVESGSDALELWRKQYSKEKAIDGISVRKNGEEKLDMSDRVACKEQQQQVQPRSDYSLLTLQKDGCYSDMKESKPHGENSGLKSTENLCKEAYQSSQSQPVNQSSEHGIVDRSRLSTVVSIHADVPLASSLMKGEGQAKGQPQTVIPEADYSQKILKAPPVSWFGTQSYPLPIMLSGTQPVPFSMGVSGNQPVPISLGLAGSQPIPLSIEGVSRNMTLSESQALLTGGTTVTTWSTSSGFSTQPQVLSSSEMSMSSGGPELRQLSSTAESLVETVYDISIKEEDIRQELQDVDQNIASLQKIIEESTTELKKYTDKKALLKKEEEKLRLKRINVLQEARDKQKRPDSRHDSDHPTPPLSSTEDSGISVGNRILPSHVIQDPRPMVEDSISSNLPQSVQTSHVMPYSGDSYTLRGAQMLESLHGQSKLECYGMPDSDSRRMMPPPGLIATHPMYYQYPTVSVPGQEAPSSSPYSHLRSEPLGGLMRNPSPGNLMRKESPMKDSPKEIQIHDLLYQGAEISVADSIKETTLKPKDILFSPEKHDESPASKVSEVPYLNKVIDSIHSPDVQMYTPDRNTSTHDNVGIENFHRKITPALERQSDDIIMVSDDQRQGSDIIIISDSPKRSLPKKQTWVTAEKPQSEFQDHLRTQDSNSTVTSKYETEEKENTKNLSQVAWEKKESNNDMHDRKSVPITENVDADSVSNLKSYGFITLSNLMTADGYSPQASPLNSPHMEHPVKIPRQSETIVKDNTLEDKEITYSPRSDTEKSKGTRHGNKDKVNVHYMGSLPHGLDQDEFLKKFRSSRNKDDQMSFLVVDGDQNKDMYDRLQLMFHKPDLSYNEETHPEEQVDSVRKDSNVQSFGSSCSLGEKIRQYCNETKPEETLITVSDEDKCFIEATETVVRTGEQRCLSPYRKKLKTKKERDRVSVRKQKEGCILDSSSDYNSPDEDFSQGSKLMSKAPDVESVSEKLEEAIYKGESYDQNKSHAIGSEVISHRLLEEVQLETESDDSRAQLKDKFAERLKLKPDFLASLKAAVRSSLAKTDSDKVCVRCHGPEEQVSGLQVVEDEIYVSYIGCSVRKFSIKTGELIHTFDSSPHQISCLYVLSDSFRLYTGGSSQHLLTFNSLNGQQIRSENLEEKLQCFHHNWGKLFIGTYTGSILVWSTKTDRNIDAYVCSDRPISCISSATEGAQKVILVAAYDSTVFVLSATSGLLIRILEGHTKTVFSLQVDGSVVYSGSGDKTVMEHNLQTGDMTWTYTQAAGIITTVCVFEDLLFCSSFDKLIRCYSTEDHKLKALYYGADKGLVTQMTVVDNKMVTGNRNGTVEVIPILRDQESMCQFEGCCLVFGLKSHMLYHVMSDHVSPNTKMFQCLWKGCKELMSTKGGQQEAKKHMKQHIFS